MKFNPVGFLSSVKLALVLLVAILLACIVGVAFVPSPANKELVFRSLWFNALLALMVLNLVFCFFRRIVRRRLTPAYAGLVAFHLSLVLLCAGAIYNSLFFFQGALRLTEGEVLNGADEGSYDLIRKGPFFRQKEDFYVYFHRLHPFYAVDGTEKGVTNEVAVGESAEEAARKERVFIYATRPYEYKGFKFHRNKDGFSPLFVLWDGAQRELYGAYSPLQSLKQEDGSYLYVTGTSLGPRSIAFPQNPLRPLFKLQTTYYPSRTVERTGDVLFRVRPLFPGHSPDDTKLIEKKAAIGEKVRVGNYFMSMEEVRYWASMNVYYQPGSPLIAASFWLGLGGITLSTTVKLFRRKGG